jgi:hypothetical protein
MYKTTFPAVSAEHLRQIMCDRQLGSRLSQMRRFNNEGFEAGFTVHRLYAESGCDIGPIRLGDSDQIEYQTALDVNPDGSVCAKRVWVPFGGKQPTSYYDLIDLHSHPGQSPVPSDADLARVHLLRYDAIEDLGVGVRPISGVLSQDRHRRYGLLLYQETQAAGLALEDVLDQYESLLNDVPCDMHEPVAEAMATGGMYRATVLRPDRNGRLGPTDLAKLAVFSFTPKVINHRQLANAARGEAYYREEFEASLHQPLD